MTTAKICAIIYTVRVPTLEYGGSLNEVKEVIVNAVCYIRELVSIYKYAHGHSYALLSDLPQEEIA